MLGHINSQINTCQPQKLSMLGGYPENLDIQITLKISFINFLIFEMIFLSTNLMILKSNHITSRHDKKNWSFDI